MADEKTITVKAPNKSFDGTREGVRFERGEAEATKKVAKRLREMGYRVPALEEDDGDEKSDLLELDGLGEKTVPKLADAGFESQADLADLKDDEVEELADTVDVKAEKIKGWVETIASEGDS